MEADHQGLIAELTEHRQPVQPEDTMAEAGRKVILTDFIKMLAHEAGSRAGEDIEEVHDMRVATRRMRSAFQLLEPYYKTRPVRPYTQSLRALARRLGVVRDLDVMIDSLEKHRARCDETEQAALQTIIQRLDKRRRKARKKLINHLDSKAYRKFVENFAAFLSKPGKSARAIDANDAAPHQVRHVLPVIVHEHLATVRAYDTVLAGAEVETLHALRIEFKRLRYLVSYFSDVLGSSGEDFIDELKNIQDHLGLLNDCSVAQEWLRGLLDDLNGDETQTAVLAAYIAELAEEQIRLMTEFPAVWAKFNTRTVQSKLSNALLTLR
jgi:CHAD domain-containing protein